MSNLDAGATPMYAAFQATPVPTPFLVRPARIDVQEKNRANAWGAAASAGMYLAEADRAPERLLNEIIWKSVKGPAAVMPPAVRRARQLVQPRSFSLR
jgi:hypothetical protein